MGSRAGSSLWVLGVLLALGSAAQDEDFRKAHVRLYKKAAPAVVGIRSIGHGQKGSGVIVSKDGHILTSPTATGANASTCYVYLKGHRRVEGRVVGRVPEKELVVVKIDPRDVPAWIELGDSSTVRVGQVAYVLGDSFDSIFVDDQPAISVGVISGVYDVTERKERSYYTGRVFETSAAVNPHQDGGALLDSAGRLIGMVTLNYHESKFSGLAIPIDVLKPELAKFLSAGAVAWLGISLEFSDQGAEVIRISKNGPADRAGLQKGDLLLKLAGSDIRSRREFDAVVGTLTPDTDVEVQVKRGDKVLTLKLRVGRKEFY